MNTPFAVLLACARLLLVAAGTASLWLVAYAWSAPARGVARVARRQRVFSWWAKYLLAVLGVRLRATGHAPAGPALVVANHLGYLDVLVLGAALASCFVAKAEIDDWPVAGRLCRFVGTVFVRRARGHSVTPALDAITNALRDGRTLVLFPEATSTDGSRVLPFHSALLGAAGRSGRPIAWAALTYGTPEDQPPASEAVCWWGEMTLADHVFRLMRVPCIDAHVEFGAVRAWPADRKAVAAAAHSAIVQARRRQPSSWGLEGAAAYNEP
jgi:1-acyl-sn-glycerol-3-phosphate acyltransferase